MALDLDNISFTSNRRKEPYVNFNYLSPLFCTKIFFCSVGTGTGGQQIIHLSPQQAQQLLSGSPGQQIVLTSAPIQQQPQQQQHQQLQQVVVSQPQQVGPPVNEVYFKHPFGHFQVLND